MHGQELPGRAHAGLLKLGARAGGDVTGRPVARALRAGAPGERAAAGRLPALGAGTQRATLTASSPRRGHLTAVRCLPQPSLVTPDLAPGLARLVGRPRHCSLSRTHAAPVQGWQSRRGRRGGTAPVRGTPRGSGGPGGRIYAIGAGQASNSDKSPASKRYRGPFVPTTLALGWSRIGRLRGCFRTVQIGPPQPRNSRGYGSGRSRWGVSTHRSVRNPR